MIDIEKVLYELGKKRTIFTSEADFQLEIAWIIKELYPCYKIRLEYTPLFNLDMHVDIMVFDSDKWIPIELKYKTQEALKNVQGEVFCLKNQAAQPVNRYLFLKDIQRIETIKENIPTFEEGYAIFLTNDLSYTKISDKDSCIDRDFFIGEGLEKSGKMEWAPHTSKGTKKGHEEPIILKGKYKIKWNYYSEIDTTKSGKFVYCFAKIK